MPLQGVAVLLFKKNGVDFVVASSLFEMVRGMNKLTGDNLIDLAVLTRHIEARDREISNEYTKDVQAMGIRNALKYPGDTLSRTPLPTRSWTRAPTR